MMTNFQDIVAKPMNKWTNHKNNQSPKPKPNQIWNASLLAIASASWFFSRSLFFWPGFSLLRLILQTKWTWNNSRQNVPNGPSWDALEFLYKKRVQIMDVWDLLIFQQNGVLFSRPRMESISRLRIAPKRCQEQLSTMRMRILGFSDIIP